jgi:hypothetical protein
VSNRFPDTFATVTRVGSPEPVSDIVQPGATAAISENAVARSRKYSKSMFDWKCPGQIATRRSGSRYGSGLIRMP